MQDNDKKTLEEAMIEVVRFEDQDVVAVSCKLVGDCVFVGQPH